jgi:hypothetical protein
MVERSNGGRGVLCCSAGGAGNQTTASGAGNQTTASGAGNQTTASGAGLLTHEALLYGSEEEFLAVVVPFIRDGLERDEPIQIATTDRNADWLRAALGSDAGRVTLGASSRCYRHPVRALAAMYRTAHRARSNGQRLRILGEPWWTARTAPQAKEWIRYESLMNSALADADVSLMCTYDD